MAQCSNNHLKLNEKGEGKCSVPMWQGGCPSGFCDEPAFSKHKGGTYYDDPYYNERRYLDGSYGGYVPGLACSKHGGKKKHEVLNLCDYCQKHPAECDGKPFFGTGKGNDNVFACDGLTAKPITEDE